MALRQPIAVNKVEKPVIIFKNGSELKEFPSIQTASKWLKEYSGYKYMPYKQVEGGIFFGETWSYNGDTYVFTTDENIRLAKLEELDIETENKNKNKNKIEPTGLWTFICNPKRWAIDDFLMSGETFDTFSIRDSDRDSFAIGDLGIVRVGKDNRTIKQLNGKQKLDSGIYAIVEVIGKPKLMAAGKKGYWYEESDRQKTRYRVPIKYIHNLHEEPILLDTLTELNVTYDKYLIGGFEGSTIPLNKATYDDIINILDNMYTTQEITNSTILKEGATKQISVNVYERNPVARRKCIEHYGCSCVICGFIFEKTYGELGKDFIHVHHLKELHTIGEEYEVNPIVDLRPVCPNCHAMLHKRKPAYSIEELKGFLTIN
ncbi:HNH endonuclease [Bacillus cereus]|nr:HNH endonuclease [Bacillus cereus]